MEVVSCLRSPTMPAPYSYDFRKQVIEAIVLDRLKKSEASQLFGISRNTIDLWLKCLLGYAQTFFSAKPKPGTIELCPINLTVVAIKSRIGRNFENLPSLMATLLKWKWLDCGPTRSAIRLTARYANAPDRGH